MSRAAYLREWRKANPERVKAYGERQRRAKGQPPRPPAQPTTSTERMRRWRAANPEAARAARVRERGKPPIVQEDDACSWCRLGPCSGSCD